MAGRPPRPLTERFWNKVHKTETCWNWIGRLSHDGKGYGRISERPGKMRPAHKMSWELANGPVPDGLLVLHRCDNTACIRPDHLWLGTSADNTRDMYEKGRGAVGDRNGSRLYPERLWRGEKHTESKLTETNVRDIRQRVSCGEKRCNLAQEYGVTGALVGLIVKRKIWRHIE